METIVMVLAPILATMLFAWSKKHFSLLEKVGGTVKFVVRYPPLKGKGSLPWTTLPLSTLVLLGYAVKLIAWLHANWVVVVIAAVAGLLLMALWRLLPALMGNVQEMHGEDDEALDEAWVKWYNSTLPDHLNND